ncbi:hypothetical protein GGR51DRAFT_517642 [Nemania sp. FL0031]|nr:hypothetical protein GGR51DRAFT_517642 [Nemania sp. FL0031]
MTFPCDFLKLVGDNWMDPLREPEQRTRHQKAVQKHCEELGMDCSTYVLSHNDLGPTNVFINGDKIAIIDWDLSGYCPVAWVRTKFAICGAMDVERVSATNIETNSVYRLQVEQELGRMGFPEVIEAYKKMHRVRLVEWVARRPWLQ